MFKDRFSFIEELKDRLTLKHLVIVLTCIVVLILISILSLIFKKEAKKDSVLELRVRDINYLTESTLEIINEGDKYSIMYENGHKVDTPKPIQSMGKAKELPKVTGTLDIEKRDKIRELTYNATLDESAKYINYLKKEGYAILREAYTSEYIEFYMTKGTTTRRIIILNNIIMTGELGENWKLPEINEYLN